MKKFKSENFSLIDKKAGTNFLVKHILEGGFILILALSAFVFLALVSYKSSDPGWFNTNHGREVVNAGGKFGAYVADLFYWFFGYAAFLLPIFITYASGVILLEQRSFKFINRLSIIIRSIGLILLLIGCCGFLSLQIRSNIFAGIHFSGGLFGQYIAITLNNALNFYGAILFLFAVFLVGLTWLTDISWILLIEVIGHLSIILCGYIIDFTKSAGKIVYENASKFGKYIRSLKSNRSLDKRPVTVESNPKIVKKPKLTPKLLSEINNLTNNPKPIEKKEKSTIPLQTKLELPALGLLDAGQPGKSMGGYSNNELENLSREVEQHLLDFGVTATVVSVHPGPVITRFELQLAAGIKVSRLSALAKDLARSLSVTSVRVVEIIPGKTVVGLELPNPNRAMVRLSEVLNSDVYQKAHSSLTLALGVDIAGCPMVVDLAKMPHLLVAGTTGSGKSVGINAMILSLLFQATPEQVRLILIDPKMLELSVYDGIPHLLTPVVTDMREAQSALRWCVGEMERRYRLMASLGVRNIAGFNVMVCDANKKNEPLVDPTWKKSDSTEESAPVLSELPYIVVVIDELADMMMVVGKKVEQLIARIAQK